MKELIKDYEGKYNLQNDLLNEGAFNGLDERTLHEIIKAMLMNTMDDCIKYEKCMDPDKETIIKLLYSNEKKSEEEIKLLIKSKNKLKESLHFAEISEKSLDNLIYEMLTNDEIKYAFRKDIPALYENIYSWLDIEEEIESSLIVSFVEFYDMPEYKEICLKINNTIEDFIENAEKYIENVKQYEYYEQFVKDREEKRKKEKKDE